MVSFSATQMKMSRGIWEISQVVVEVLVVGQAV